MPSINTIKPVTVSLLLVILLGCSEKSGPTQPATPTPPAVPTYEELLNKAKDDSSDKGYQYGNNLSSETLELAFGSLLSAPSQEEMELYVSREYRFYDISGDVAYHEWAEKDYLFAHADDRYAVGERWKDGFRAGVTAKLKSVVKENQQKKAPIF